MTQRAYRRVDDVVQREVAGEMFLVPVRGEIASLQELFALNEVGSWLWARLDGSRSLSELVAGVVGEFEVGEGQASHDVTAFLEELVGAGLVHEVASESGS